VNRVHEKSEDTLSEFRLAWRSLVRTPGTTAAAVLTVALGIGVNVALFSVVDRLMFRPLPYAQPHRLVQLHDRAVSGSGTERFAVLSQSVAQYLRDHATSFEDVAYAGVGHFERRVKGLGDEPVTFGYASGNLLRLLGIRLVAGQIPDGDVDGPGQPVLLTTPVWQAHFGSRPDAVGAAVGPYRIIGVLPPDFLLPSSNLTERIHGVVLERSQLDGDPNPRVLVSAPVARLRSDVTVQQAQAEVDVLFGQMPAPPNVGIPPRKPVVQPLQEGLYFLYRTNLWLVVLSGAAGLLIACVNLSTLLLARSRSAETVRAIRLALGASPGRIVAGTAIEAILISTAGAALAIVVCVWSHQAVLAVMPAMLRGFSVSPVDTRLLALSVAATLTAGLAASIAPAWHARRTDTIVALQVAGKSGGRRLRGAGPLLATQAGFGVLLVVGAAVMVANYVGMVTTDSGWNLDDLYVLNVNHGHQPKAPPPAVKARVQQVVETIEMAPGVVAAGAANRRPFDAYGLIDDVWETLGHRGGTWGVTANLFDAMGMSLRAGRFFTREEVSRKGLLTVLNEKGVRALWPDTTSAEALGRRVRTADGERLVIGVIADVRRYPGETPVAGMYVPLTADEMNMSQSTIEVLIRMAPGQRPDLATIKQRLDERFGVSALRPPQMIAQMLSPFYDGPRFLAVLFGTLAAIALALAAIGVFALAAFDVARRRHEMAVRVTLGATQGDLRRLIQQGVLRPVLVGSAAGLIGAWWAAQFAQALVIDIDVHHPVRFAAVAGLFAAVASLAAWLPVRRAARTPPADVLRAM
jgi:predicted permease